MKILAGGRRTGKTTRLIQLAGEAHARGEICYIVVHSINTCSKVFRQAREMEIDIRFPITFMEFANYKGAECTFLIDEIQMLLPGWSKIKAISLTIDHETEILEPNPVVEAQLAKYHAAS